MPFQIIRNDITKVPADAIVNTANPEPVFSGGTDAAIYRAAGEEKLLAERRKIGRIHPGEAAVTSAFNLPADYIIHTVGPIWRGGSHGEYELLASCYRKSLLMANQLGCRSIAFPLISTGVYGFPKDKALDIALGEISRFLEDSEMNVTLVVFDRKAFDLSAGLTADVGQYIDEHYVNTQLDEEYAVDAEIYSSCKEDAAADTGIYSPSEEKHKSRQASRTIRKNSFNNMLSGSAPRPAGRKPGAARKESRDSLLMEQSVHYESGPGMPDADTIERPPVSKSLSPRPQRSLQDVMSQVGESFQECLLRLIDERGFTDAQVYKRANIDRKLFSKIRCNPDYLPRRKTIISLAVALELNMDEMVDLLLKAGIALSPGNKFDLIIRYCVENRIYDTMKINALLFDYDQPLLGA